jgi:hypothetical protein
MGRYLQSRDGEIVVPEPSWCKILVRNASDFGQEPEKSQRRRNLAATNASSASLRSENDERKSAVEMTPRGKRGKLAFGFGVFHSFHGASIQRRFSYSRSRSAAKPRMRSSPLGYIFF